MLATAACAPGGLSPAPASEPPRTVEVAIRVDKARDQMLEFYAHGYEVHVTLDSGETYRWRFGEPGGVDLVPSGRGRIDVRSIVYGDTVECTRDPATGIERCLSPEIGAGERCSVEAVFEPRTPVALLFRLLPNERCQLNVDPRASSHPGSRG